MISPCHEDLLINNRTRYFLVCCKTPRFEAVGCTTKDEETDIKQSRSRTDVFGDSRQDIGPAALVPNCTHMQTIADNAVVE